MQIVENIEVVKYAFYIIAALLSLLQLGVITVIRNWKNNSIRDEDKRMKNEDLQWENINRLQLRLTTLETEHKMICKMNKRGEND